MAWWDEMAWAHPPAKVVADRDGLHVVTASKGDYWRQTFYGFTHDNGHFLHRSAGADFTAEARFDGQYQALYDQAGLMIRLDAQHWIKAGIEFVGGVVHVAVVVTNGMSDWSQMPLPAAEGDFRLRLTRAGDAVWVQYGLADAWKMVRLAWFPPGQPVTVGPMCCSPSRAGFAVTFKDFTLGPVVSHKPY